MFDSNKEGNCIYYEIKLKDTFLKACDNHEQLINNEKQWQFFTGLMLRTKLASIEDSELLEKVRPSFPLTFETFIQTVNQAFGDQSLKNLNSQFDETQEQLENCRTFINMMNISLLRREELKQLAELMHKSSLLAKQAQGAMDHIFKGIKGSSEDVQGFVWDKIDGSDYKLIKLPHEAVKQDKATLEREFINKRVRQVHYRKLPVKILKKYDTGIEKVLGFCCDRDKPVENYKIPKNFAHYDVLTQFYNQIGATKELLLSKYCLSYLGFDDQGDPDYNQYFFESNKVGTSRSLWKMFTSANKTKSLLKHESLFKYWAKELLFAFRDITYRSTYTLQKPITLKNVFVADPGIKICLKKIKFGDQRDDNLDYHMHVESTMLAQFAMLLIQMLTCKDYFSLGDHACVQSAENDLQNLKEISPELKCILYECLHASDKTLQREEDRYDYEIKRQIQRELNLQNGGRDEDFLQQEAFKEMMKLEQSKQEQEEEQMQRLIPRKKENPQANTKNFMKENERMGVSHEVDLILEQIDKTTATGKYDRYLVQFSQQKGSEIKKAKEARYLTVQGLLDHPYFTQINEADISTVIDEFDKLKQGDTNENE